MDGAVQQRLALGQELVNLSGKIIRSYFRRSHLSSETKLTEVSSIVTIADQATEQAMVDRLRQAFPADGILREEGENYPSQSGYTWVIDPIDGTSSFVKGFPIFGTLLGLVSPAQVPLWGIADQPILQERWQGVQGQKSFLNGEVLRSPYAKETPGTLTEACLVSTTPLMFISDRQKAIAARFQQHCQRTAFGGDCYNYLALAAGWTAMPLIILESDMKYYDFCALIPIVEGAGGMITDWQGQPLTPASSEVLATANPHFHQLALALIQGEEN